MERRNFLGLNPNHIRTRDAAATTVTEADRNLLVKKGSARLLIRPDTFKAIKTFDQGTQQKIIDLLDRAMQGAEDISLFHND